MSFLRPWTYRITANLRVLIRNDTLVLAVLAMLVGAVVGGAVVAFRELIVGSQFVFFGSATEFLAKHAADLDWWRRLLAPAAGGLIVGLVIYWLIPQRRPLGIADVVEVVALRAGRMPFRDGVVAALVSAMSIGAGASVGREGPAVHLGATLASVVAAALHLTRTLTQTLLGCGVAAAVAASFNAPIAGALFATEVVLGHYALSSFAPVVIASVVATFVSRGWYGPYPALEVMDFPDISL